MAKCKNIYCEHRRLNNGECMSMYGCVSMRAFKRMDKFIDPKSGHTVDEIQEYWCRQKNKILISAGYNNKEYY